MAIAIPSVGRLPKLLYWSCHGFDWSPLLPSKRPGYDWTLHARLLGAGLDLRFNQAVRLYSFSVGAEWLLNVAAGVRKDTSEDGKALAGGLSPSSVWQAHRYVEITIFLFKFCFGQEADRPWRLRFFWNLRRVFHSRG